MFAGGNGTLRSRTRATSVQAKFSVDDAKFRGFDQSAVRYTHRVQWPVEFFDPEIKKLSEVRKPGMQIIILPDERLKQRRMVRHMVQNFGRGQAVSLERFAELLMFHEIAFRCLSFTSLLRYVILQKNIVEIQSVSTEMGRVLPPARW